MSYETGGKFGSHQIGEFTDKCRCGATRHEVLDHIVNEFCSAAVDPKLVDRIARAMCKADGNDPSKLCIYRHELAALHGLVAGASLAPLGRFAWQLYARAAETAIIELEAAAVEPFHIPRRLDDGSVEFAPAEQTQWFPPSRAYIGPGACGIKSPDLIAAALAAQAAIDKEAVEIVVSGYSE